jgi:NAD+-dependent protein deacetylase sirtuin 4
MRISVPTIPALTKSASVQYISPESAIERLANFLLPGNATLLTGAGVSVDSGVRAYRGEDGRYMNPIYK